MFITLVAFGAGLVIGWNFLPQPAWVSALVAKYLPKK
jgi:hypothetical protein